MDRLDRQIFHGLLYDGRASFRRLAEVLDTSEQTVARRYRALHELGVIRVVALPTASARGHHNWMVRMRCRPDSGVALGSALAAREDVSWVSLFSGGAELTCSTTADPSAEGGSVLLQRLPQVRGVLSFTAHLSLRLYYGGAAEWRALPDPLTSAQVEALLAGTPPGRHGPPSGPIEPIRPDDLPLVRALSADGRASAAVLARDLDWPVGRVTARLAALLDSGAIYVDVDYLPERMGFHAAAQLWLTVEPRHLDAAGRVLSELPEVTFAAAITGAANLLAGVTCRTSDELYRFVTRSVGVMDGVRQMEIAPMLRRLKQAGSVVEDGRLRVAPAPR